MAVKKAVKAAPVKVKKKVVEFSSLPGDVVRRVEEMLDMPWDKVPPKVRANIKRAHMLVASAGGKLKSRQTLAAIIIASDKR